MFVYLKNKTMQKEKYNSKELIEQLHILCSSKQFKKPKPLPEFTLEEALFIRDLIFLKPKEIVYFYLADHLANRTPVSKYGLFNSLNYRKYLFIKNYFICKGNATKTAILSGYSRRSAKQQGHRILKQIQKSCRDKV